MLQNPPQPSLHGMNLAKMNLGIVYSSMSKYMALFVGKESLCSLLIPHQPFMLFSHSRTFQDFVAASTFHTMPYRTWL